MAAEGRRARAAVAARARAVFRVYWNWMRDWIVLPVPGSL